MAEYVKIVKESDQQSDGDESNQQGGQDLEINEEKSAWVYAILLAFLGPFGAHRFYVNKAGSGILYLFTLGIFGIGTFIDGWATVFSLVKDDKGRVLHGAQSLRIVSGIALTILTIILFGLIGTLFAL